MTDPSRGDPGVCGGQVEIFVEPSTPKPTVLLIDSGHVGKAVAHLADWLGFYVVVSDDRPEFCNQEAVPAGKAFFPVAMAELPVQFEITPWTYIVLTTRGVNIDVPGLPGLQHRVPGGHTHRRADPGRQRSRSRAPAASSIALVRAETHSHQPAPGGEQ